MGRVIFLIAGHLCMALAFVGIFVPILPTVPFILLAACCYSRGSKKFYSWLVHHPKFGPAVVEWRDHRIVRPKAKVASVITIAISLSFPIFYADLPVWLRVTLGVIGISVIVFLLSCPSAEPKDPSESSQSGAPEPGTESERVDANQSKLTHSA